VNSQTPLEQLLRWRLARAQDEAPPAPRAARLLELARPWWDTWPERFQKLVERLGQLEVAYGHAMAEPRRVPAEPLVPAIVVHTATETETSARLLYLSIRDGHLRLRFELTDEQHLSEPAYEVTFVCRTSSEALFSAVATRSANGEYSLSEQLSDELTGKWGALKVTDAMPFRLILRSMERGD
jgi:hypothetical protein